MENKMASWDIRKILLVTCGLVAVGLGFLGVVLPLLPTTPFLLLAAACFLRSSRRLYLWLMHHRVFGPYLRNYMQHRAISIRAKAISIILIWATITYSAFWVVQNTILRIILLLTATIMSVRILLFKTLTSDMTNLD
jgi:uncharacterized membrane protein YbaN (DUF454 family)